MLVAWLVNTELNARRSGWTQERVDDYLEGLTFATEGERGPGGGRDTSVQSVELTDRQKEKWLYSEVLGGSPASAAALANQELTTAAAGILAAVGFSLARKAVQKWRERRKEKKSDR